FTTGGVAHEGGSGAWLIQESEAAGIPLDIRGFDAEALAAWGAAPEGAVAGTGGIACPKGYDIKGNLPSRLYHLPGDFAYTVTIPEFCFNHEHAAVNAGFTRAAQRGASTLEAGSRPAPRGAVHAQTDTCPESHPIKGNAQSGYYHRPIDPSYKVTKPEFCFATEAEAQAAGFIIAGNAKKG
ncbi:MAG: hypothetical protein ACR2J8_13590, partial [Thermomicrobiales bacterium]